MKIQRLSLLLFVASCCLFFTYTVQSDNDQQRTTAKGSYTIYTSKDLESLYAPIIFSPVGIRNFLRNTFNRSEYAAEVLPNDFSHMLQCLENGARSNKKRTYSTAVIRLFLNKVKAAPYISAYAFADMLPDMLKLLAPQTKMPVRGTNMKSGAVYDILYAGFAHQFDEFKKQPRIFLSDLSSAVVHKLDELYQPDDTFTQLCTVLLRFFENVLGKLIWHPEDGAKTWENVKLIADHLAEFVNKEVISNVEDLNDLYISLLERYVFFVDISTMQLPLSFYQQIKADIAINSTLLLDLEEQEKFLEPKAQRLMSVLNGGEAKSRARHIAYRMR